MDIQLTALHKHALMLPRWCRYPVNTYSLSVCQGNNRKLSSYDSNFGRSVGLRRFVRSDIDTEPDCGSPLDAMTA